MSETKKAFTDIGALWLSRNDDGSYYGSIEAHKFKVSKNRNGQDVIQFSVFPNQYKKEPKHPDLIIKQANREVKIPESETKEPEISIDDIPF